MGRTGLAATSLPAWCFFLGVLVRASLFLWPPVARWLGDRVELSTPVNSWFRVIEAISLEDAGISPYETDVFHEGPIMLLLYKTLLSAFGSYVNIVFILADVLIAVLLEKSAHLFARYMLVRQEKEAKQYHPESLDLVLNPQEMMGVKNYVLASYLLHPYIILSCVARSTCVFSSLGLVSALFFTLQARRHRACLWLAFATYQSLYSCVLVVPVALFLVSVEQKHVRPLTFGGNRKREVASSIASTLGSFLTSLTLMLLLSSYVSGSWAFLRATYGFHLTYPDMTPNLGLFWYFFIEIFDHFRVFYLWVFQSNAFFYVVPLTVLYREQPIAMFHALLAMLAIFKPYPTYADAGLWMSMLPMWYFSYAFTRTTLPTFWAFLTSFAGGPVIWQLWIFAGSANSNFYFAMSLMYNVSQMFLITDVIYGLNKRLFFLFNGFQPVDEAGRKQIIILK